MIDKNALDGNPLGRKKGLKIACSIKPQKTSIFFLVFNQMQPSVLPAHWPSSFFKKSYKIESYRISYNGIPGELPNCVYSSLGIDNQLLRPVTKPTIVDN